MALNTVTLTWNLEDFLLHAVGLALITVTPSAQVVIESAGQIVIPEPRSVTFSGGTGSLAGIIATDNAGMSPATFEYAISVINLPDTRFVIIPEFTVPITHASGSTQDLSALLASVL